MSFDPDQWLSATEPEPFDPDAWLQSTKPTSPTAPLRAFAQDAEKGVGAAAKGAAALAELPNPQDRIGTIISPGGLAEYERLASRGKAGELADIQQSPLYRWGKSFQEAAAEVYPVSTEEQKQFLTKLGGMAGSFLPLIASGLAAPATIGLQSIGDGLDTAYQQEIDKGTKPEKAANRAINRAMASGAIQSTLFSVLPAPLRQAADKALVDRFTRTTLSRFLASRVAQAAEGATLGAASRVGENIAMDRPDGEDVGASAGGLAAMQALLPRGGRAPRPDDTGKNVPESRATLEAQQEQLVAGRRPAQMFPAGTEELPLPEGFERVETPRGVFHFDPEQLTPDHIREVSAAGRENEILGLGVASKDDVAARGAAGEPVVAVTERTPEGTEVKTAVATSSTVPGTTAEIERAKTPGNRVQTEPVGQTITERQGNLVDQLLDEDTQRALARREAELKQKAERQQRQDELSAKKARFDETLTAARTLVQNPEADFPTVNGALESMRFYAEDNAIGLTTDQRQAANKAVGYLQQRADALRPAWEQARAAAADQARKAATTQEAARAEAHSAARSEFKAAVKAGEAAGGGLDYERLPETRLTELAQQGNTQAERALMRRNATPRDDRPTLLDVLRRRKLPDESGSLPVELRALIDEGMTPKQRRELVAPGKRVDLDKTAETLREEGFSWIATPADVIDAVQRALHGEDVRADWGGQDVAFAAAKRSGIETAVQPDAIDKPVLVVNTPGKTLRDAAGSRIRNDDTGREIIVPRAAVKKAVGHTGSPENQAATSNAPELLRTMRQVASERDNRGRQNILAIHRFVGAVHQGDTALPVRVTVREMRGGDMILHHIEAAPELARQVGTSDVGPGSRQPSSLNTGRISRLASPANPAAPGEERSPTVRELLRPVKGEDGVWRANFAAKTPLGWGSVGDSDQHAPSPRLSDADVQREIAAIRRQFPGLTRELDLRAGLVEEEFRRVGHRGPVPENVRAGIAQLDAERRLLVIATQAAREGQAPGLFLHEMAHPFFDALPDATRAALRSLHDHEMATRSGPLFDAQGKVLTDIAVRREDFPRSRLRRDPDLPVKEWFAERMRRLNEEWLAGRIPRDQPLVMRVWQQLLAYARHVFASVRGLDPGGDLFTDTFRRWLDTGARADVRAAGAAFAERSRTQFASEGKRGRQSATWRNAPSAERRADADKIIAEAPHVEPIPGRKDGLLAELKRGRDLRTEGFRTGNERAAAEGNAIVQRMRAALDSEFPGWEAREESAKSVAAHETDPAAQPGTNPPDEPPPGDGEASPFAPDEGEPMPIRRQVLATAFGHGSYEPTALARGWEHVREVLRGFKSAIPELPTFPAAFWNRADRFIKKNGAAFYGPVREFLTTLRSGNDYVQRTAEEQLQRIVAPLMHAGPKFAADDYARLRRRQEQVRRLEAEDKPVPPGVLAEITALDSQLEASPYVLFNKLIYYLDLRWRYMNLRENEDAHFKLPTGLNIAEVNHELRRIGDRIAASPDAKIIETAMREHMALVRHVADDLRGRDLLDAEQLANPYYFPHVTLETTRGGKTVQRELTPQRVRPGTEEEFRGYLIDPVGSDKPIESDYARAMYYHLVQVGAHNWKSDAVREVKRTYDVMKQVEQRAKQLSRERGTTVSWQQAFNEEFAPEGYVTMGADNPNPFGAITVDRDALARRLGVTLTSDDLHEQLRTLGLKGIKILPEDLHEILVQANKEVWIVPARVAEALRGIAEREGRQDPFMGQAARWMLGQWKAWKLFMPQSHIRYEANNIIADMEKLVSAAPRTFLFLPRSAREVREFWMGKEPTAELRSALKEGVINAVTAQELGQLHRLPQWRAFETWQQKLSAEFKAAVSAPLTNLTRLIPKLGADGLLGRVNSVEQSAFREATFRYAKFLSDLEALNHNARPQYAGAYWKNVDAIRESSPGAGDANVRKAAAIARATFVDYGDLSVTGQWARDKLVPFYSWLEGNFKYHANLFRNLRDMVRAGEIGRTQAAGAGARAAAAFATGFGSRVAAGVMLRLALPYLAVWLYNNRAQRELEDQLSEEDRRRFHVILGKDANGKVEVVYGQTALQDVYRWFSGERGAQGLFDWMRGRTDFATAFGDWSDHLVPDFLNNVAGGLGPYFKLPYIVVAKKNPFPDVTDQRTVPAFDMRRVILSNIADDFTADLIERAVNKDYYASKDLGDWAKQLILQVRQRDPEQWAFYGIKDKANDYLQQMTGQKRDSSYDAPDQQVLRNFRRAIYRGDAEKAVQFYLRLLDYGYTSERFAASIRAQNPLAVLPKALQAPFVASLSEFDRQQLVHAFLYYQKIENAKGYERQLFPSARWGTPWMDYYRQNPRTDLLQKVIQ